MVSPRSFWYTYKPSVSTALVTTYLQHELAVGEDVHSPSMTLFPKSTVRPVRPPHVSPHLLIPAVVFPPSAIYMNNRVINHFTKTKTEEKTLSKQFSVDQVETFMIQIIRDVHERVNEGINYF